MEDAEERKRTCSKEKAARPLDQQFGRTSSTEREGDQQDQNPEEIQDQSCVHKESEKSDAGTEKDGSPRENA